MKKIKVTAKLGDLAAYDLIDNEVSASFSLDYGDESSLSDLSKQIQGAVDILIGAVVFEKTKQENSVLTTKEEKKGEKEGEFSADYKRRKKR